MITDVRTSLIKFQIGPVQDFIAAARSTRDLWSGSYLLSFLIAAGIRELIRQECKPIFPIQKEQPLLYAAHEWSQLADQKELLTPNLPNLFVAEVPAEKAQEIVAAVRQAIDDQWMKIADSVWESREKFLLPDSAKDAFYAQAPAPVGC